MTCPYSSGGRNRLFSLSLLVASLTACSLSCVSTQDRMQALKDQPAPHIEKLSPSVTLAGTGFQVQPSGESAISVAGSSFMNASRILLNGRPAVTTFGSSTALTALVPAEFYSRAGDMEVTVENADGRRSNAVLFRVLPVDGPAPQLRRLRPNSSVIGQAFNVQPGGDSALAVEGANFVPGAVIYFDALPLLTTFGDPGALTAIVPPRLLQVPRAAKVYVRNPDGNTSAPLSFSVER